MANLAGFNAAAQGEMRTFEAMPAHKSTYMITASEMKPNKAGTGAYLQLTFDNLDGPYKGRKLFIRLNVSNPNKQAEDIANRELGAICKAVGVLTPQDSVELHNKPMIIDVGFKAGKNGNADENYAKSYAPLGGTATAAAMAGAAQAGTGAAPAPAAPATTPATPPATPPWAKK